MKTNTTTQAGERTHTPGPWTFCEQNPRGLSGISAWGRAFQITAGTKGTTDEIYVSFCLEEGDARLIAAAPDLLAALTELLASHTDEPPPMEHNREHTDYCVRQINAESQAREVIAKATTA